MHEAENKQRGGMSGENASEKLRRRAVHGEEQEADEDGAPETVLRDPFVKQEGKEEDDWGLDDEEWKPGETEEERKPGKTEETPATRRRRIIRRSALEVGVAFFCHLILLCFYMYAHIYDGTVFKRNKGKGFTGWNTFGGRWKFLSYIDFWLQFSYFFLAFFTDIMPRSSAKLWCQKLCDNAFTAVVFPMALFVSIAFWSLYAVDPELVQPVKEAVFIPQDLNHYHHTTIVLGVLIEAVLVFHRFPTTMNALVFTFLYVTGYIIWIATILTVDGYWVYPFFRVMPPPLIVVFFITCFFITVGLYYVGKMVAYIRWKARHQLMDELHLSIDSNLG